MNPSPREFGITVLYFMGVETTWVCAGLERGNGMWRLGPSVLSLRIRIMYVMFRMYIRIIYKLHIRNIYVYIYIYTTYSNTYYNFKCILEIYARIFVRII